MKLVCLFYFYTVFATQRELRFIVTVFDASSYYVSMTFPVKLHHIDFVLFNIKKKQLETRNLSN